MKVVTLSGYASFQCMAGACPSTCCAGWSIQVDGEDYARFRLLEPEWLRQDILSNIQQKGSRYFFKNEKSGACAMLDGDGLCRIQRNASEETLCNTCRKYPRLFYMSDEVMYLSMAASCPVISRYLVRDDVVEWHVTENSGRIEKVTAGELALTKHAWKLYQELREDVRKLFQKHSNISVLYQCFVKMAQEVLEIICKEPGDSISAGFFSVFEKDVSENIEVFLEKEGVCWEKISDNYMNYRLPGRKMEFPEESDIDCIRQAQGELFLLRTLAFCRFCEKNALREEDWQDLLQRVYRFCVHGKKVSGAFRNLLGGFFSQDALWSYVLL